LIQQTTDEAELAKWLNAGSRTLYAGFDPTADSLHVGHLMAVMILRRFQQAGHRPIALVGGATGMIGDPTGKSEERNLLSVEALHSNVASMESQLRRFLDFDAGGNAALLLNNFDWMQDFSYLAFLRDIGKHFPVNVMLAKDSVQSRLDRDTGISYTEFSYMLLQAYDFLHLKREHGCSLQMSGSDQFGNIAAGVDLIHRVYGREGDAGAAYGITAPLLTRADGKKFGKSVQGAISLSADRTSPYALYQFFFNVEDAEVVKLLKWYTFMSREQIEAIAASHSTAPERREAQRELARAMTETVHGKDELARVEAATQALFGGDVRGLDERTLGEVFADVPHSDHALGALDGDGHSLVELLTGTTLASSKREARQFLEQGAIAVNGERAAVDRRLTRGDLLHGARILLRRGKRQWHATRWA
jgi:tyrosyl-tRNA synthetase